MAAADELNLRSASGVSVLRGREDGADPKPDELRGDAMWKDRFLGIPQLGLDRCRRSGGSRLVGSVGIIVVLIGRVRVVGITSAAAEAPRTVAMASPATLGGSWAGVAQTVSSR